MLDGNENLICKENGRLYVGGKEFNSATSALVAYIDIFKNGNCAGTDKKQVPAYKREVGDLLLPKSCLQLTAERSLDCGVRDTTYEIQLFNQKKKIEKLHTNLLSLSATGDINSQADQTIKETEVLLKDLQNGRASPTSLCCFSDIGSLTTEYLLSASPYPPKANLIERDEKGVCKKCGNCSVKSPERSKQPIYQTPSEVLMKNPVPLPINSSSSKNSSGNVGKCQPSKQHHVTNKDAWETPKLPSKIKNIGEDRKKVILDSMPAEISPKVEFRQAESLTCTKADWQNIDSCDKSSGVIPSTFNNCLSTKSKQLKKISNNVTSNKSERTSLPNQSKTKSEFPPHTCSSATKKRQNLSQSQCKQSLSKNNFCKYLTSQTCKESGKFIKKVPKSKSSPECAALKALKSPQEEKDKQRTSENLMAKSQKKKVNNIQNSQEIPHVPKKNISQNPNSNKQSSKLSKSMKNRNGSGTNSYSIPHSPRCKQTEVSDFCDSKNLDSLPFSSNNQHHKPDESTTRDAQKNHKKLITSPDVSHLPNYKNPQVPNWVKELESSRMNTPVPTEAPAQQISPLNLVESWSISGIPFDSPAINPNQTSFSPQKDPECKCFENKYISPYQELSEFITNIHTGPLLLDEDDDLPQFQNQSIQSLLDRYLNDQTKELSKLKSFEDTLTDESVKSFGSRKLVDDSSFNDLCATYQSSRPLSPLSCEAVLDDPCFDKNKEMPKVPFTSSTPNRGQHCPCSNKMTCETNPNPFWDDFEFQNGDDEHRCMETLKNMLFRLQVEEESVQSPSQLKCKSLSFSQSKEQKSNSFSGIPQTKSAVDDLQISSLSADNAGIASFDKAFEHLHRLRAIVNGDQVPDL